MLKDKSILLGVTGSVAAYKAADLIRRFRDEGAAVKTIMTESSKRFITPLSLELAAGGPVHTDLWESPLAHVTLPAHSDLFIIAPATANIMGKFAQGIADDLLTTALLAYRGKVIIAPAMNWRMWDNPLVQRNLSTLTALGVMAVGPEQGSLACGEEGFGRMAGVEHIIESARTVLTARDLAGEQVLVTAGPTREYLDPVRYLSNRSSGKMGYALARVARRRGAAVTLITGPVSIEPPRGVAVVNVATASQMREAVMGEAGSSTIVIMAAAVADFTPAGAMDRKIEKTDRLSLELVRTADILNEVGSLKERPFTVGFSAETGYRLDRAREKLARKKSDMIVFNDVSREGSGFDVDTNEVVILDHKGETKYPLATKEEVAMAVFDRILELKGHAAP